MVCVIPMYVYIYIYMYVCMYVRIYVYIYIYTYTCGEPKKRPRVGDGFNRISLVSLASIWLVVTTPQMTVLSIPSPQNLNTQKSWFDRWLTGVPPCNEAVEYWNLELNVQYVWNIYGKLMEYLWGLPEKMRDDSNHSTDLPHLFHPGASSPAATKLRAGYGWSSARGQTCLLGLPALCPIARNWPSRIKTAIQYQISAVQVYDFGWDWLNMM